MLHLKCFGEPLLIRPHSWLENMQTETERPWSFVYLTDMMHKK